MKSGTGRQRERVGVRSGRGKKRERMGVRSRAGRKRERVGVRSLTLLSAARLPFFLGAHECIYLVVCVCVCVCMHVRVLAHMCGHAHKYVNMVLWVDI